MCVNCESVALEFGVDQERERIKKALKLEQERTGLGFIQYKRAEELIDDVDDNY